MENKTENTGIDVVYWINLKRAEERRIYMETQVLCDPFFKNIPIIQRIEAMDGSMEDISKYINTSNNPTPKTNTTTNKEYACTVSHLNTIYEFSKTDYPIALVLEDDVSLDFKPYWKRSIAEIIKNAPNDWEILQLSYIIFQREPKKEYQDNPFANLLCGTAGYIIRNTKAKQWMDEIAIPNYPTSSPHPYPIYQFNSNMPHQADKYLYMSCKTYCYKYPPFTYRDNNNSYLHQEHVMFHEKSKKLTEYLHRYNTIHPHWCHYLLYDYFFFLLIIIVAIIVITTVFGLPRNTWNGDKTFGFIFQYIHDFLSSWKIINPVNIL
jgi:GR25 family glycosyltransferase involved in LPS biosynthesis